VEIDTDVHSETDDLRCNIADFDVLVDLLSWLGDEEAERRELALTELARYGRMNPTGRCMYILTRKK